jgi:P27 family predicted phage terminase small subunit
MPGNAGRKVIPIDIKKAKGTYQPCRDREVAPPSNKKPVPPSWLNARAKQIFHNMVKRLAEIHLDSATYTEAIALLSSRLEEVERFDKILNEGMPIEIEDPETKEKKMVMSNGYVYSTHNSYGDAILKENPAVALREKAFRHVHTLLTEFGLTGASAQKVGKPKDKSKASEFDDF